MVMISARPRLKTKSSGPDSLMIGRVLWDEFFLNRNWPMASAVAIALLLVLVIPIMVFQRYQEQESGSGAHR